MGAGAADSLNRTMMIKMCAFVLITAAVVGGALYGIIYGMNYSDSDIVSRYVQDLYVPSLVNRTTTTNSSVLVELKFEREYALRGLQFKEFQMTLFYGQSGSRNFPVGSSMVEGFSMRRKMKRVHVIGKVEAVAMPWQEALQAITAGNVVTMAVELRMPLDSNFRYTADVVVDASAHIKQPIQLSRLPLRFTRRGV